MKIGEYTTSGELGRGGMGVVLRGTAPDGREVAIKLLRRVDHAEALPRFERERRLLASLGETQGFVPLLDAGESVRGPYIVMPLVSGGSLRAKLDHGALPALAAVSLVRRLASAVGRAHERGIVHRDLKPENVLFTHLGVPLVADLGLAKHFRHDSPGASQSLALTQRRRMHGTAGYMPREQMLDAASVGPPADVFALGAILYECVAGEPAFHGLTLIEVIGAVTEGRWTPLSTVAPAVPGGVAAVVTRCLDREPSKRFADGEALAAELSSLEEKLALGPSASGRLAAPVVFRADTDALKSEEKSREGSDEQSGEGKSREEKSGEEKSREASDGKDSHASDTPLPPEPARRVAGGVRVLAGVFALVGACVLVGVLVAARARDARSRAKAFVEAASREPDPRRALVLARELPERARVREDVAAVVSRLEGLARIADLRDALEAEAGLPPAKRLEVATHLLALDPSNEVAVLARARARFALGREHGAADFEVERTLALSELEEAAQRLPDSAAIRWELAQRLDRADEVDRAFAVLVEALPRARGPLAALLEARVAELSLDMGTAIDACTRAEQSWPAGSSDRTPWLLRARYRTAAGDWKGARADARRARDGRSPEPLVLEAGTFTFRCDDRDAIKLLDEALALDPRCAEALGLRASILALGRRRDRLANAHDAAERALRIDPDQPDALCALAQIEQVPPQGAPSNRGESLARALLLVERAAKRAPLSQRVLRAHAEIEFELRDAAGAARDTTRARKLDPRCGWAAVADAARVEAEDPEARAAIDRLIEAGDDPFEPLLLRAWYRLRPSSLDAEGAESDASRALDIDPASGRAYAARARARLRLRNYAGAVEDCKCALEAGTAPSEGMLLYLRGRAYVRLHDTAHALEDFEAAKTFHLTPIEQRGVAHYEQVARTLQTSPGATIPADEPEPPSPSK